MIKIKNFYLKILLIFLYALGLYISLKVACGIATFDPDEIQSLVLWAGIQENGWGVLTTYNYMQDSFLFSFQPIYFVEYWLFGTSQALPMVVLTAWFVFVLIGLASGLIAFELRSKISACLLPLFFIFANSYVYQNGYALYPSHNISVLYGLISIWLLIRLIKKSNHGFVYLIPIFLIQLINIISDPWFELTMTIPLGLVACSFLFLNPQKLIKIKMQGLLVALFLSLIIKLVLLQTALSFLAPLDFQLSKLKEIPENFWLAMNHLGGFFNFIPGFEIGFWAVHLFCLLFIFLLLAWLLRPFIRALYRPVYERCIRLLGFNQSKSSFKSFSLDKDQELRFFLGFVFFSCCVITLFFGLVLNPDFHRAPGLAQSGRYLINIFYFLPMVILIVLEKTWPQRSRGLKYFLIIFFVLYGVAGLTSNWQFLGGTGFVLKDVWDPDFINYLKSQNLTYGYGPYFGANANTVTLLSRGSVVIRPIHLKDSGLETFSMSFQHWYVPSDAPIGQKYFFIIVNDDGWECRHQNITLCAKKFTKIYGEPIKIISHEIFPDYLPFGPQALALSHSRPLPSLILVWDHPLIGWYSMQYLMITLNQENNISQGVPLWEGWGIPTAQGMWSRDPLAFMYLKLDPTELQKLKSNSQIKFIIHGQTCLTMKHPVIRVEVWANKTYLTTWFYQPSNNLLPREVEIPLDLILKNQGKLNLEFKIHNPVSPSEMGYRDQRTLGLLIKSFELESVNQ